MQQHIPYDIQVFVYECQIYINHTYSNDDILAGWYSFPTYNHCMRYHMPFLLASIDYIIYPCCSFLVFCYVYLCCIFCYVYFCYVFFAMCIFAMCIFCYMYFCYVYLCCIFCYVYFCYVFFAMCIFAICIFAMCFLLCVFSLECLVLYAIRV
jgi:hypothetical protein